MCIALDGNSRLAFLGLANLGQLGAVRLERGSISLETCYQHEVKSLA